MDKNKQNSPVYSNKSLEYKLKHLILYHISSFRLNLLILMYFSDVTSD